MIYPQLAGKAEPLANTGDPNQLIWKPVDGTSLKQFPFVVSDPGIKARFYSDYIVKDPYDVFKLFLTDKIVTFMVIETNCYAEQKQAKENKPKSQITKWTPTTNEKWKHFQMCLCDMPYWKKSQLYSNQTSKIIPRNRFELFLAMWHFSDTQNMALDKDQL